VALATNSLGVFCSSVAAAVRLATRRSFLQRSVSGDACAAVTRVVVLAELMLCRQIIFLEIVDVDDGVAGFGVGIVFTSVSARFVVYLLTKGMDLSFRVGGIAAIGGSSASSPTGRLPIFVQRLKSILVGASGRWLLRLYQALRSSGGEEEALCFGSVRDPWPGGTKERGKMNRALRDLLVFSFFVGVLFVSFLIYKYSLFAKKKVSIRLM
jgi:hypothetical protein